MNYVKPLSGVERLTLKEMYKNSGIHRLRQRAHIILMSANQLTINQIATVTELDRDTLSLTMKAWDSEGIGGLYDGTRHGRPTLFNDEQKKEILKAIEQEPRSLKVVLSHIEETTGKRASLQTIKRIAKAGGLTWKRMRKTVAGSPDPKDYEEKREKLQELKDKSDSGDIQLYFQDESGFSLMSQIPYGWQLKGQAIEIPASRSQQINVLGFLGSDNDWKSVTFTGSVNSDCIIEAIEQLFPSVKRETWFVMDNAPTHKSRKFVAKINEWAKRNLHVLFLPPYSPELNPIEIVWRFMKYFWIPLSAYGCFKRFSNALDEILVNYGTKYRINFG